MKYKNYAGKKVLNEGIYQLAFYAHWFHKDPINPCKASIIYPKYANEPATEEVIDLLSGTPHAMVLHTKPVSIESCLDLISSKREQELAELVLQLLS